MSDLEVAYRLRMRESPQFRHFKLTPQWVPGIGDVEGFIHDEVVRQFHDPRVRGDGGMRIEWMLQAWYFARGYAHKTPTVAHLMELGKLVEPYENDKGFRREPVWIGDRQAPDAIFIKPMIEALFKTAERIDPSQGVSDRERFSRYTPGEFTEQVRSIETADDFYLAYEWIHPWRDGNGRTGKILHNWLHGTLDDPVLVADYFGGHNP